MIPSGKGLHGLSDHALFLTIVARREVKRLEPAHAGRPSDLAGCGRRQVSALMRLVRIVRREPGLQEEDVGALRQLGDRGSVRRAIGDVGDVGDLLSRAEGHQLFQVAEPHVTAVGQTDH